MTFGEYNVFAFCCFLVVLVLFCYSVDPVDSSKVGMLFVSDSLDCFLLCMQYLDAG